LSNILYFIYTAAISDVVHKKNVHKKMIIVDQKKIGLEMPFFIIDFFFQAHAALSA